MPQTTSPPARSRGGCRPTRCARARRRAGAAAPARRRASRRVHRARSLSRVKRRPNVVPRFDACARRPPRRPAAITAARAHHRAGPDPRARSPTRTPSPSDGFHHGGIRAHVHAVVQHRALDARVRADRAVAPEHALRPDVRPRHEAVLVNERAGLVARRERGVTRPAEQVPGGLEVALGRPDVDPVAGRLEAVQAVAHQRREDLALERHRAARRDRGLDQVALDHVGAGVDPVGGRLAVALLDELEDGAIVVRGHDPVARGVLDGVERERGARPLRSCCSSSAVRSMSVSTSPFSTNRRSSSSPSS